MEGFEYPVTALRICLDRMEAEEDRIEGRVFGVAVEQKSRFVGISELLLTIDRLLDQIGKPQASRKTRSFTEEQADGSGGYCGNPKRYHTSGEISGEQGACETRDVYFTSRQKSTWQGFLKDGQGGLLGEFKSDLEFINLLLYDRRVTDDVHNEGMKDHVRD